MHYPLNDDCVASDVVHWYDKASLGDISRHHFNTAAHCDTCGRRYTRTPLYQRWKATHFC